MNTHHTQWTVEGLGTFTSISQLHKALRANGMTMAEAIIITERVQCPHPIHYPHHVSGCQ